MFHIDQWYDRTTPQRLDTKSLNDITYENGNMSRSVVLDVLPHPPTENMDHPNWFDSSHNMLAITYGNDQFTAVGGGVSLGYHLMELIGPRPIITTNLTYQRPLHTGMEKFVVLLAQQVHIAHNDLHGW